MVAVDTTAPDFGDSDVQFMTFPGTREREAALIVRRPSGTTLVLNDLVGNIRGKSGVGGWLLRLAGFAGDQAQIPKPVKFTMVKDSNAVRGQLLQWTQVETLKRIIVITRRADRSESPPDTERAGWLARLAWSGSIS